MGMNYFLVHEECPLCGSEKDKTHIGKISYGWKPLFRAEGKFRRLQDFIDHIAIEGGIIIDEEDNIISPKLFFNLVKEINKKEAKSHIALNYKASYVDSEGFEFVTEEFC